MKRLRFNKEATKSGVASFYIVIFATILFGVVTLSFMRIILSESHQSSDDDLSRSAYDSAVAGVEDAKTAINRYYNCLSNGGGEFCDADARKKLFKDECDDKGIGLAQYLYGEDYYEHNATGKKDPIEILLQEGTAPGEGGNGVDNASDQAYTCVIISDRVPDYRGVLSPDTRTRIIPLNVNNGSGSATTNIGKISFNWYSRLNQGEKTKIDYFPDNKKFPPLKNDSSYAPAVSLTLIRVGSDMSMDNFMNANNSGSYTYSTVVLLPTKDGDSEIGWLALENAGNVTRDSNNGSEGSRPNQPFGIKCQTDREYACRVDLTGLNFDASDNVFLVVSLPYGNSTTDFMATMSDTSGAQRDFTGVQISVDSTGRTNQLVRRVESRLDPIDLFFPYPQYEIELSGENQDSILKNFWITANCWYSQPPEPRTITTCNNNGPLKDTSSSP